MRKLQKEDHKIEVLKLAVEAASNPDVKASSFDDYLDKVARLYEKFAALVEQDRANGAPPNPGSIDAWQ